MPGRLRVGVPTEVPTINPMTGTGNMWRNVLAKLADRVDITVADPTRRRGLRPNPQVWLSDCGLGALNVREPLVVQVHEAGWADPQLRGLFDPRFLELVLDGSVAAAVRRANHIVAPSQSARDQIIEYWGVAPDRVHAVPHGVDSELFRPGRAGAGELIHRQGGVAAVPYVLFVSTLHPRKNLGVLRNAVAELAADGFPHQLVLVAGRAEDREDSSALEREAQRDLPGVSRRVVRFNAIPDHDLAALMAGASAFCLPSLMEGFGLTALEAMSAGVPVVTSNRGSLPEVVGDAGLVVEPTVSAVKGALARVLSDTGTAAMLGRRARERALLFSWDRTADGWAKVLETAAG